jgi:hypothetical protein
LFLKRFCKTFFSNAGFLFFIKIQNIKMKPLFLTGVLCISTLLYCNAQKIEPQKVFGGYNFTLNGARLTFGDLVTTMQANPEASKLINTAKGQNTAATILAGLGGGLAGWEIGNLISGKPMNLAVIGAGAGLIVIALPIGNSCMNNALKAVDLYNAGLKTTSLREQPTLNLVSRGNGIGLMLTF